VGEKMKNLKKRRIVGRGARR